MSGFEREQRVFSFQDGHTRYRWLLASPAQRLAAGLFDLMFTAAAAAPAGWLLHQHFGAEALRVGVSAWVAYAADFWPLAAAWVGLALYALAQVWRLSRQGQTFGKALAGIRIVRADGKAAGMFQAWLLRSPVFVLLWLIGCGIVLQLLGLDDNFAVYELLWIPYVLCFAMLFNLHDDNRTLQDKLAGTAVVRAAMQRED